MLPARPENASILPGPQPANLLPDGGPLPSEKALLGNAERDVSERENLLETEFSVLLEAAELPGKGVLQPFVQSSMSFGSNAIGNTAEADRAEIGAARPVTIDDDGRMVIGKPLPDRGNAAPAERPVPPGQEVAETARSAIATTRLEWLGDTRKNAAGLSRSQAEAEAAATIQPQNLRNSAPTLSVGEEVRTDTVQTRRETEPLKAISKGAAAPAVSSILKPSSTSKSDQVQPGPDQDRLNSAPVPRQGSIVAADLAERPASAVKPSALPSNVGFGLANPAEVQVQSVANGSAPTATATDDLVQTEIPLRRDPALPPGLNVTDRQPRSEAIVRASLQMATARKQVNAAQPDQPVPVSPQSVPKSQGRPQLVEREAPPSSLMPDGPEAPRQPHLQSTASPNAAPSSQASSPAIIQGTNSQPQPVFTATMADARAGFDPVRQLETVIEQVSAARETGRTARPELSLRHSEFGLVNVKLEAGANDLRATLASRDPGFLPAFQSALTERIIPVLTDPASWQMQRSVDGQGASNSSAFSNGQSMMGSGAFSDPRYGSSPGSGQAGSQPYSGQDGHDERGTNLRGAAHVEGPPGEGSRGTDLFA